MQPAPQTQQQWTREYDQLKSGILTKRARGTLCPAEEVRELSALLGGLEWSLGTMKEQPMAYEMTLSELSRRALITENLKKQLSLLNIAGKARS